MRGATTALLILLTPMVGCHVATGDGYFGGFTIKTALFMEQANSTNLSGYAYYMLSNGDLSCDDLETGLEAGSMWRETEEQNGVYGMLWYSLTEDPDDDPWIGVYSGAGVSDYDASGTVSQRAASALWFNEEGLTTTDATGLVVDIDDSSNDKVTGYFWHVWDEFSFNAEHCGSYGT